LTVVSFAVFTADDAIQSYTIEVVNYFLKDRKNPNGCSPKMTYFNSVRSDSPAHSSLALTPTRQLNYNNYSMVRLTSDDKRAGSTGLISPPTLRRSRIGSSRLAEDLF
jgi:hypothetical protein